MGGNCCAPVHLTNFEGPDSATEKMPGVPDTPTSPTDSPAGEPPKMPFTRFRRIRSSLSMGSGGSLEHAMEIHRRSSVTKGGNRRDSQCHFAKQEQTIVVFDWDDTLFPTTYVNDDVKLNWKRPLRQQKPKGPDDVPTIAKNLSLCEEHAMEVLRRASCLARVVVVTLASTGAVDLACRHFYPTMGTLLQEMCIPIVYAQAKAGLTVAQHHALQHQSVEENEKFWGLIKGRAIAEEADRFYSQYEGQSWKNILSIGDSSFERYGLLAATSAYMQETTLTSKTEASVWNPTQRGCWQKVQGGHVKKVRAKCCKLVDQPEVSELALELEMVSEWLEGMVNLDAGFDLDLEAIHDEEQIQRIGRVFSGERPVSDLPKPIGLLAA